MKYCTLQTYQHPCPKELLSQNSVEPPLGSSEEKSKRAAFLLWSLISPLVEKSIVIGFPGEIIINSMKIYNFVNKPNSSSVLVLCQWNKNMLQRKLTYEPTHSTSLPNLGLCLLCLAYIIASPMAHIHKIINFLKKGTMTGLFICETHYLHNAQF